MYSLFELLKWTIKRILFTVTDENINKSCTRGKEAEMEPTKQLKNQKMLYVNEGKQHQR